MNKISEDELLKVVKKYYEVSSWDYDPMNPSFTISNFESYPEENFNNLLVELKKYGIIAFTVGGQPVRISLIESGSRKSTSEKYIKVALLIATLISVSYFGFSYQSAYDTQASAIYNLGYSLLFYTIPLTVIFVARESVKYVTLKKNGIPYSPSILIPDPLGLGTMGIINSPKNPYRDRKVMIDVASYSLIIGFFISVIFYILGSMYTTAIPSATQTVNFSIQKIGSPVLVRLILGKFIPSSAIPDTLALAGLVGIITTSFNALPIGLLDGGVIGSSLIGRNSIYLSYASLLAVVALSIFYAPWIILALFAVFVGLKGPQPLNNMTPLRNGTRALVVIAFVLLFVGVAPVPIHTPLNQFTVSTSSTSFLEYSGHGENLSFSAEINNSGSSSIIPGFSFSPSGELHISGSSNPIPPGSERSYQFTVNSSYLNKPGINRFNFTVYSGTYSRSIPMMVMDVNLTEVFSFNDSNPYIPSIASLNSDVVLSLSSVYNETLSIASFSQGDSFQETLNGGMVTFNDSFSEILPTIEVGPLKPLKIPIIMKAYKSPIYLVAYNSSFDAAISILEVNQ